MCIFLVKSFMFSDAVTGGLMRISIPLSTTLRSASMMTTPASTDAPLCISRLAVPQSIQTRGSLGCAVVPISLDHTYSRARYATWLGEEAIRLPKNLQAFTPLKEEEMSDTITPWSTPGVTPQGTEDATAILHGVVCETELPSPA